MQDQDREEQRLQFLKMLAGGDEVPPGHFLEVRPIKADAGPRLGKFAKTMEEALLAVEAAECAGLNVHPACSLRWRESGEKAASSLVRVLWLDIDVPDLTTARERWERIGIPPTLVLDSGGGGAHVYWVLRKPLDCRDPAHLEALEATLRGMIAAADGDPARKDASSVMRCPGTTNRPNAAKRAKGRVAAPCRIFGHRPERAYDFSDFEKFRAADEREAAPARANGSSEPPISCEELASLLEQLDPCDHERHDEWRDVMFAAHEATGGAGVEEFVRWSARHPKYVDRGARVRSAWGRASSNRRGRITRASLYRLVLDAGGTIPGSEFAATPPDGATSPADYHMVVGRADDPALVFRNLDDAAAFQRIAPEAFSSFLVPTSGAAWPGALAARASEIREVRVVADRSPEGAGFALAASGDVRPRLGSEAVVRVLSPAGEIETFADLLATLSGQHGAELTLERIFDSLEGFDPCAMLADAGDLPATDRTDVGNARLFATEHAARIRFVEELRAWIAWHGGRWSADPNASRALALAKDTARRMALRAVKIDDDGRRERATKWALASHGAGRLRSMVDLSRDALVVTTSRLDRDAMLLNVRNGILDLRTHRLRPHDPSALLTKMAPTEYVPGARCPLWEAFLARVQPDEERRGLLQRLAGYGLQGGQDAKAFAAIHGPHDSGKSTALGAIADALGHARKGATEDDAGAIGAHYATTTSVETFGSHRGGNHPSLVKLMGARLVLVNEIPKGSALESRVVKAWTGGDALMATPKYGHPVVFYADGLIVFVGNELPETDFEDDAMWERFVIVPFDVVIPERERDRALRRRFDPRGILAWLVEGHRQYAKRGLDVPESCRARAREVRAAADPLAEFWAEAVELKAGAFTSRSGLWNAYTSWASDQGLPQREWLTKNRLTRAAGRHFEEIEGVLEKDSYERGWSGIQPTYANVRAEEDRRAKEAKEAEEDRRAKETEEK